MTGSEVVVRAQDAVTAHVGLTVTTYRVDPATGEKTQPITRKLRAVEPLEPGGVWRRCQCPRCRA